MHTWDGRMIAMSTKKGRMSSVLYLIYVSTNFSMHLPIDPSVELVVTVDVHEVFSLVFESVFNALSHINRNNHEFISPYIFV